MSTTASDILKYRYTKSKAEQNDITIEVASGGFRLINNGTGCMLGKIETVEEVFQYLCGYEAGLDIGLAMA